MKEAIAKAEKEHLPIIQGESVDIIAAHVKHARASTCKYADYNNMMKLYALLK